MKTSTKLIFAYVLLLVLYAACLSSCRIIDRVTGKHKRDVDSTHTFKGSFHQVDRLDSGTLTLRRDTLRQMSEHNYQRRITIHGVPLDGALLTGKDAQVLWDSLHGRYDITIDESGTIREDKNEGSATLQAEGVRRREAREGQVEETTTLQDRSQTVDKKAKVRSTHWLVPVGGLVLLLALGVYLAVRAEQKKLGALTRMFKP